MEDEPEIIGRVHPAVLVGRPEDVEEPLEKGEDRRPGQRVPEGNVEFVGTEAGERLLVERKQGFRGRQDHDLSFME